MKLAALAPLLSILTAGCGGAGMSGARPSNHEAIVGGTDDVGDPAVVAIEFAGFVYCSGALIGPETVLTAGHCANGFGASDAYKVDFGSDATSPTQRVKVQAQLQHPQYTAAGAPYDFALLRLAQPVLNVPPVPLATAPLTQADVGSPIRHAGFGVNDESAGTGGGIKRTATYPITEVDPLIVWSVGPGMQTCTYDSGGPGFVTRDGVQQVAAVVSDGPNCTDAGWDGRVDVVVDWIRATQATWDPDAGPPGGDGGADTSARVGACGSAPGAGGLALVFLALCGVGRFNRSVISRRPTRRWRRR